MLKMKIPGQKFFNEETDEFIETRETTLLLEHSLVSISKWESKYHKPFFSSEDKTLTEILEYVRCMNIENTDYDDEFYRLIPIDYINKIIQYIEDPMTATWISENEENASQGREKITSELIYYWMIALNIPMECEEWHLNRLFTLIRIASIKNAPEKKMDKRQSAEWIRKQNEIRRAKYKTRG